MVLALLSAPAFAQGAVDVTVPSSASEPFTQAALLAAKGLSFKPATQSGAPISVVLAYRYRFEAPVLISADAGEVALF